MELTNTNDKKRRKPSLDMSSMVYGKVPPQAKELEEAILGACMLEKNTVAIVADIIKPECFYIDAHQKIFKAMCAMEQRGFPVEILTVVEELKNREELDMVGGPYALAKLTNMVVSSANVETHARIILQKFFQREVIRKSGELIALAYEDSTDPLELLEMVVTSFDEIANKYIPVQTDYITLVANTLKKVFDKNPEKEWGILSRFKGLDSIIDFFLDGFYYIIAARPAMGKTSFMVQLVENFTRPYMSRDAIGNPIQKMPKPVGIIEMETFDEAFIHKQLANISDIDSRHFKKGHFTPEDEDRISEAAQKLVDKNIICDFHPTSTASQIRVKAKRWKAKYDIGVLLIDYLQFVEAEDDRVPRERQVAKASKSFAALAKELGIPVIAFAQLSREVYKRADKRPQLSDLRESGSIEQDARVVMFLHRPKYYGDNLDPITGLPMDDITEVIIAKNNEGTTGTAILKMIPEFSKFVDETDMFNNQPSMIPGTDRHKEWDQVIPETPNQY